MFDKNMPRYLTAGIKESIPIGLQKVIWDIIDSKVKENKYAVDYLQVFNIKNLNGKTEIKYSQEEPVIKESHLVDFDYKGFSEKIYVIDEQKHATMLLAAEY